MVHMHRVGGKGGARSGSPSRAQSQSQTQTQTQVQQQQQQQQQQVQEQNLNAVASSSSSSSSSVSSPNTYYQPNAQGSSASMESSPLSGANVQAQAQAGDKTPLLRKGGKPEDEEKEKEKEKVKKGATILKKGNVSGNPSQAQKVKQKRPQQQQQKQQQKYTKLSEVTGDRTNHMIIDEEQARALRLFEASHESRAATGASASPSASPSASSASASKSGSGKTKAALTNGGVNEYISPEHKDNYKHGVKEGEVGETNESNAAMSKEAYKRNKYLKLTGDLRLAPVKARARLGSEMTPRQRRAQMKAEQAMAEQRRRKIAKELQDVLNRRPTESQLKLPENMKGQVSPKALRILGDEKLEAASLRQIPANARITPKAILVLGEPELMPRKARKILGVDYDREREREHECPQSGGYFSHLNLHTPFHKSPKRRRIGERIPPSPSQNNNNHNGAIMSSLFPTWGMGMGTNSHARQPV